VSLGDLNRHRDHFPDADVFRPERYLDPAEDTSSWLVFSVGTRRCLGATFSLFELGIVFSRIVQRTDLVAVGRPEGSARAGLSLRNGVSSLPRRGVRVIQPAPPEPVR
jgi:cytochrome P450